MSTVDPSAIATAAVTSALVSLGIEWAAKPRLEARKERILAAHRAREVFRRNLVQVWTCAVKLDQEWPQSGLAEERRRALHDEKQRMYEQIETLTKIMADSVAEYALTYPSDRLRELISRVVAVVRGVVISGRTQRENANLMNSRA